MGGTRQAAVALITGAGSGIGRSIALALAREGYALALVGRRSGLLSDTALACAPARAEVVAADLSTLDGCRAALDACVARLGTVDALINNAGMGVLCPIARTSPELVEASFRINALAPAYLTLLAWPHFERRRAGCVINISSMATIDPYPGFFAYAGSKAAVNLQTASIAREGAAIGVRAFAIAPGAVETRMLRAAFDRQTLPPDRVLDPAAVAELVVECLAGRHDHLNGRTIPVLPDSALPRYREWVRDHPPVEPWHAPPSIG
jgi:NAD(P)-dependent dehydrogenase (short-subunit alcohol dehydrogenase family)